MSRAAQKLFHRLQGSTTGWSHDQLARPLQGMDGIRYRETNHGTLFEYGRYSDEDWATVLIPRHKQCKQYVGKKVLKLLEKLVELEGTEVLNG